MSDHDELARLRRADPVDPTKIPSAQDPAAAALREGIVMDEIEPTAATSRTPVVAAAAAAVLLVATASIVLATRGTDPPAPGPIVPPGQASCVEEYNLETLATRAIAFDGTVTTVSGDQVTFAVNEWFRGGTGAQVTLKGASTIGGTTSAGPSVTLDPGTRLLVAGDGGFAWSCGFTQPYDAGVAAQWKSALD